MEKETSTEEKILDAARRLFLQKGYAKTTTRDIAAEAGINLALLNYYFRSKEKLFQIIMEEKVFRFLGHIKQVLQSELTLEDKVRTFVSNYIDLLNAEPDLPLFILSELRSHPEAFIKKTGLLETLSRSNLFEQLQEAVADGKMAPVNPVHLIMNLVGLTVFPFIGKPILMQMVQDPRMFSALMEERKELIPHWLIQGMKTVP